MPAPKVIKELIDRFDRNLDAYRSGHYNEAQVRAEFIDPLFEALGWDIDNEQGHAEAYKDIDEVMAHQADLVEVVTELKQVLCAKG